MMLRTAASFFGLPAKCAVQVHQMQAGGSLRQPMFCSGGGIFRKHRGIFHHTLFEAHTMTVFQINRRNY